MHGDCKPIKCKKDLECGSLLICENEGCIPKCEKASCKLGYKCGPDGRCM